jgi:hypothetical protein
MRKILISLLVICISSYAGALSYDDDMAKAREDFDENEVARDYAYKACERWSKRDPSDPIYQDCDTCKSQSDRWHDMRAEDHKAAYHKAKVGREAYFKRSAKENEANHQSWEDWEIEKYKDKKEEKKANTDYVDLALGVAGVGALEALIVEEVDYHLGDLKKQWEEEEGGYDIQPLIGLDTHTNATRTDDRQDRSEHADAADISVFHNPCAAQPRALHVRDGDELLGTLERVIAGRHGEGEGELDAGNNHYALQFAVLNILAGFQDTVNAVRIDENGEEILDPELMEHNTYIHLGDNRPGDVIMAEYAAEHAGAFREQNATIERRRLAADKAKKAADKNQEEAEGNDPNRDDVDKTADEEDSYDDPNRSEGSRESRYSDEVVDEVIKDVSKEEKVVKTVVPEEKDDDPEPFIDPLTHEAPPVIYNVEDDPVLADLPEYGVVEDGVVTGVDLDAVDATEPSTHDVVGDDDDILRDVDGSPILDVLAVEPLPNQDDPVEDAPVDVDEPTNEDVAVTEGATVEDDPPIDGDDELDLGATFSVFTPVIHQVEDAPVDAPVDVPEPFDDSVFGDDFAFD